MKKLIMFIVILVSQITFAVEPNQSAILEIEQLKAENAQLKETIKQQDKEIRILRALCKEAGINLESQEKKEVEKLSTQALSIPMFGVYLGESEETLGKRFGWTAGLKTFEEIDHPGKILQLNSKNPNVKELLVSLYNNQVYEISVELNDASDANYEVIRKELEAKYKSKNSEGLTGALFGKSGFNVTIDGIEIKFEVDHNIGLGSGDTLKINYTHMMIFHQVCEEIQRHKARRIGTDL